MQSLMTMVSLERFCIIYTNLAALITIGRVNSIATIDRKLSHKVKILFLKMFLNRQRFHVIQLYYIANQYENTFKFS